MICTAQKTLVYGIDFSRAFFTQSCYTGVNGNSK